MKTAQAYAAFAGMYLWTSIAVFAVPLDWQFGSHPSVGQYMIIAWGVGCALGSCITASMAAVLLVVVSSFRAQSSGQRGGGILTNGRRDLAGFRVWHDAGDGNVNDFFDTSLLKQGKDHHLWDNRGNVFTATKHPKTGDNVVTIHLDSELEETPTGRRVVKRDGSLVKRDNTVDSISASYNCKSSTKHFEPNDFSDPLTDCSTDSGSAYDDYGDDDAQADGQRVYYDLFVGENHEQLVGPFDCNILAPKNGDNESANIAITPQGNGLTQEIEPACGA